MGATAKRHAPADDGSTCVTGKRCRPIYTSGVRPPGMPPMMPGPTPRSPSPVPGAAAAASSATEQPITPAEALVNRLPSPAAAPAPPPPRAASPDAAAPTTLALRPRSRSPEPRSRALRERWDSFVQARDAAIAQAAAAGQDDGPRGTTAKRMAAAPHPRGEERGRPTARRSSPPAEGETRAIGGAPSRSCRPRAPSGRRRRRRSTSASSSSPRRQRTRRRRLRRSRSREEAVGGQGCGVASRARSAPHTGRGSALPQAASAAPAPSLGYAAWKAAVALRRLQRAIIDGPLAPPRADQPASSSRAPRGS